VEVDEKDCAGIPGLSLPETVPFVSRVADPGSINMDGNQPR